MKVIVNLPAVFEKGKSGVDVQLKKANTFDIVDKAEYFSMLQVGNTFSYSAIFEEDKKTFSYPCPSKANWTIYKVTRKHLDIDTDTLHIYIEYVKTHVV